MPPRGCCRGRRSDEPGQRHRRGAHRRPRDKPEIPNRPGWDESPPSRTTAPVDAPDGEPGQDLLPLPATMLDHTSSHGPEVAGHVSFPKHGHRSEAHVPRLLDGHESRAPGRRGDPDGRRASTDAGSRSDAASRTMVVRGRMLSSWTDHEKAPTGTVSDPTRNINTQRL